VEKLSKVQERVMNGIRNHKVDTPDKIYSAMAFRPPYDWKSEHGHVWYHDRVYVDANKATLNALERKGWIRIIKRGWREFEVEIVGTKFEPVDCPEAEENAAREVKEIKINFITVRSRYGNEVHLGVEGSAQSTCGVWPIGKVGDDIETVTCDKCRERVDAILKRRAEG